MIQILWFRDADDRSQKTDDRKERADGISRSSALFVGTDLRAYRKVI